MVTELPRPVTIEVHGLLEKKERIQDPKTQTIQKNGYLLWHRQHDANFQGNPLLQATKRHLNNSERVKNYEK